FGQLALKLVEHYGRERNKARVYLIVYVMIMPWKEPLRNSLTPLREGYQAGLTTGDLEFASFCSGAYCVLSDLVGKDLRDVEREMAVTAHAIRQFKQGSVLHMLQIWHQTVLNLMGLAEHPSHLVGVAYDEDSMRPRHVEARHESAFLHL